MQEVENVIIIGSGPAAHSAAVYAARAELHPLLFEGFMAGGVAAGGQLTTTTDVENYVGFPEGIQGPVLMVYMRKQSVTHGTRIITETITEIDLSSSPFQLKSESGDLYSAKTVIVATGATAKRLHLPGEETYWQHGISACAVCDGALPLFRDKPLLTIGGGDAACEEASHLTKFGSVVYMLIRRDQMRASKVMQKRVLQNKKITVLWNSVPISVSGDGTLLQQLTIESTKTKAQKTLDISGLFYAIGHEPNTAFLNNQLDLDETKYIITKPGSTHTSVAGVFAAGDVQDKKYRQAITSAGTGCMAALDAEHYLAAQGA